MRLRDSSLPGSGGRERADGPVDGVFNIRTKPPHIYDNITRRLLQLGVTLALTTFVGLIVRYIVKEFDPSVSTITVTTSRVGNRDIASLSVSKNFLERILEFVMESISLVGVVLPLGFPLCTIFNRHFARVRAGSRRFEIKTNRVLSLIPKYLIIGDALACQLPSTQAQARLRPLVRDTIYHLIKSVHLKPKLIVEDSHEEARKLAIRIGLIRRDHHRLAVIKSVDLLKHITDSRGDIKQGKVRYLLSRMKVMSQSTPADKSLLVYLIKHCEPMPNENLAYLGYNFTDPEAMRLADCALTFQDCDDEDVKRNAQVIIKSDGGAFTDVYLFLVSCLITSNITQSYALYQISASVSCCIYRFLCITVFQEQLLSHSQFVLLVIVQQVFAILALMTKWLASLAQAQMRTPVSEMSHAATDGTLSADLSGHYNNVSQNTTANASHRRQSRSTASLAAGGTHLGPADLEQGGWPHSPASHSLDGRRNHLTTATATTTTTTTSQNRPSASRRPNDDDTLGSSSSLTDAELSELEATTPSTNQERRHEDETPSGSRGKKPASRQRRQMPARLGQDTTTSSVSRHSIAAAAAAAPQRTRRGRAVPSDDQPVHLSGLDLDQAVINSKIATNYKQSFRNSSLIDDVTYRLAKLNIAYQTLVMIIIIIFGNAMFHLNMNNNRQHQTLALNSLFMNNIFNLANCFNQFGEFNLRSGFRNHPFFLCVLLSAVALQVCLTELNAFGLENLNPSQWFVCFVFALMSALISPLTGQQRSQRDSPSNAAAAAESTYQAPATKAIGAASQARPRPARQKKPATNRQPNHDNNHI